MRSMLNLKTHEISLRNWLRKPKINFNRPLGINRSPMILWVSSPKITLKSIRMDEELYNKESEKTTGGVILQTWEIFFKMEA